MLFLKTAKKNTLRYPSLFRSRFSGCHATLQTRLTLSRIIVEIKKSLLIFNLYYRILSKEPCCRLSYSYFCGKLYSIPDQHCLFSIPYSRPELPDNHTPHSGTYPWGLPVCKAVLHPPPTPTPPLSSPKSGVSSSLHCNQGSGGCAFFVLHFRSKKKSGASLILQSHGDHNHGYHGR